MGGMQAKRYWLQILPVKYTRFKGYKSMWLRPKLGAYKWDVLTEIGFLRKITNSSARIMMNRINLWQMMRSISSDCLIAMLTRTEFTEPSMSTLSRSFRLTTTGFRSNSFEVCTSTSGLLCRSTTWEGKFSMQRAAVRVARTAFR